MFIEFIQIEYEWSY